jgi:acylglycerol lipase
MPSITNDEPFSLQQLQEATEGAQPPPKPEKVTATDGVELAVRSYLPKDRPPRAILVFLHGGGAHSGAGYQHIGQGLCSSEYDLAVYMPDLRGHGASGGPRGDAPSAEQVLKDVTSVLDYAKAAHINGLPLFLGGHSSGGGLVVNYSAWTERLATLSGYVLLSPQLGYLADTMRPAADKKQEFATVSILPFIVNGITGMLGHNKAVRFRYGPEVLKDEGMVSFNTVNMANAITPTAPKDHFRAMNLPLGLWVGADDELFIADKVVAFVETIDKPGDGTCGVVIPSEKHLGILVSAHRFLGPWIIDRVVHQTGKREKESKR